MPGTGARQRGGPVARRMLGRGAAAPVIRVAVAVLGLSLVAGCGVGGDDDEDSQSLTVFAAASLTGAFTEIAEGFERDNPGVRVRLSFNGSSGLVDQLAAGAPADVFASADLQTMDRVVAEGLVAGEPTVFATNVLTLVTPPGNPAGITGLDSSLDATRLVVCAGGVPCGSATGALATAAGVELAPVSEEYSVTDVLGKVTSGEADAGIVYATDARAAGDSVEQIAIPGADAARNRYPIAVLDRAAHESAADHATAPAAGSASDSAAGDAASSPAGPEPARRFIEAVTGASGRAVLAAYGFGPP